MWRRADAVFLLAFAVCFIALGVGGYYYALWTAG